MNTDFEPNGNALAVRTARGDRVAVIALPLDTDTMYLLTHAFQRAYGDDCTVENYDAAGLVVSS